MVMKSRGSSGHESAPGVDKFRIVFLVGGDRGPVRAAIDEICRLERVKPVAVLVDTDTPTLGRRLKNLRRNTAREGIGYLGRRLIRMLRDRLEVLAAHVIPPGEIEN